MRERVCAVVVNFNGGDANVACVESLLGRVEEIVVVDNGSSDGSLEAMQQRFGERVRFVPLGRNEGLARARNAGAVATDAPVLFFFDNDAIADDSTIDRLLAALASDPHVGVAAPVVLDMQSPEIVQTAGLTIDRFGFPVDRTTGLRVAELPSQERRDVFFAQGCAQMIRTALFRELGGYDEDMFFGCEDVDLCWRTWLAGYRVVSVRAATCRHRGASTLGIAVSGSFDTPQLRSGGYVTSRDRIVNREANTFRTMLANLGSFNAALYLAAFFPMLLLEGLASLCVGRFSIAAAYGTTVVRVLAQLPATLRRRRAVQRWRRVPDGAVTRMWSRGYEKLAFLRRNGIPRAPVRS